ncbi:TonB-dependent receptor plug domain-containing protein [Povalibacter sp.]|uniref:TonB-dependent receptor plug domain-containing protein n=1 Tax=Povalibacter sp. TaxID=1962978 RepID=UPI002F3F0B4E
MADRREPGFIEQDGWLRRVFSRGRTHGMAMLLLPVLAHSADELQSDPLQSVVVTGSRIRSETGESSGPVTVVTQEQLTRGGNDSLGKVLQTLPYNTGAPLNTSVNNGGDGSTRIALRGLQPQRTVILLNGRRLPNGGIGADSSVDIDAMPLSMVERVEVLTTGASAVYGADAIGGVINLITRRDFDGVEVGVQHSQTDQSDGAISRANALVGGDIGSGHWMLGADFVDQRGVLMSEREYSAIPLTVASLDGARVPFGALQIADGRFGVGGGNALGLRPGPYTRVAGATGQTASDWRPVTSNDVFNFAPYNYLQTPNERWSLWLMGSQPVGGAELFVEGLFTHRESAQSLAPSPFMVQSNAAPTLPDGTPYIPHSNYYNPFGVPVTQGARRLVELGPRGYSQEVEMWRALAGIRGRVGDWNWEVSGAVAEADAVTRESGGALAARVAAGIGPSGPDAAGNIVCGTRDPATGVVPANAIIENCVPINLFGGAGSITQEQVDFMSAFVTDEGSNSQRLASIGFGGPWRSLPAGDIQWALGMEFRRESGAYRYDPQRINGAVGAGSGADIPGGDFEAREAYAEVRLPLLDRQRGAGSLDATLGGRWSDFSTFGSNATWHAGLRWAPSTAWAIRADYTTVFRAPALNELYETQVTNVTFTPVDPCGQSPSPEQQIHCAANGVPGGSYIQAEDDVSLLSEGGNLDLDPEKGYAFDAGIEFGSQEGVDWRASLDFFRTQLDAFIERDAPEIILQECASHGTPLACSKIQRLPDGALRSIDARRNNLGSVSLQGLDLNGRMSFPIRDSELSLHALVTHLLEYDVQVFEGSVTYERVGRGNFGLVLPEWRALGGINWARNEWSAGYTLQWIGPYADCSETLELTFYCGQVPAVFYHDIDAVYERHGIKVRAGVTNLTDQDPPYLSGEANTNAATYRLLGRTYFLQLSYAMKQ